MQFMNDEPYLPRLTARLADGLAMLPGAFRQRHADYLRAAQSDDGGWPGRAAGSDLYYTGFALRGLAALGELTPAIAANAANFLTASLTRPVGTVDFFSLLYSGALVQVASGPDILADAPADWPERVAGVLAALRRPDGGYGQSANSGGSTYHTFLVALCYQLLGRSIPEEERAVAFVLNRRRDDGGFVEFGPMKRSGTNPTAAAIGLLQIAGALTPDVSTGVADFLAQLPTAEGGFAANTRMPVADLLSTFTGCWTLDQLGALARLDVTSVNRYAKSLARPDGGYHGGVWDGGFDAEYTFYGLGVAGLVGLA